MQDLDEDELENSFATYCDEVANTAAWGGQAELNALANVLQQHIKVYAVGLPVVDMGKQFQGMLLPCLSSLSAADMLVFKFRWWVCVAFVHADVVDDLLADVMQHTRI